MEFDVRAAAPDDGPAIRRVARDAWHAVYDDVLGTETVESVLDDWYDLDGLERSVVREDGRFLVAEADDLVVGFAQGVRGEDGPARLPRIYVHPDRWGEGVGTTLLGRIEAWLREADAERLRLAVVADNEVGNVFYETRGYEVVEEREAELFDATFAEYVREKEL